MTALFSLASRGQKQTESGCSRRPRVRTKFDDPPSLNPKCDDGILFIYDYFPGDPEAVQEQALEPQKNCLHRESCHVA